MRSTTPERRRTSVRPTITAAHAPDLVEVWGLDSFPASDPPSNW